MNFKNKTVIVTGANRGIGKATAMYFFEKDAQVVFATRNPNKLFLPKKMEKSKRILIVKVDVTKIVDIKNMVKKTINRFKKIDILVNNAGVDAPCSLFNITEKHLDYVWNINVKAVVMCSKYVAKEMAKRKYGKIINLSSIAGKEGSLYHIAYSSSKHAVIGITKCMARELIPYNINVNAVCPGLINTDMLKVFFKNYAKLRGTDANYELNKMIQQTPRGKMGEPQDVAELIGFLSSDAAVNIVGHAIGTDGGILQH
jgi:NAD(P)-dependent dehydrogenase (short-subunit alcohol dehydrogenase family)